MTLWVARNRWKSSIVVLIIALVLALPYLLQKLAQKALLDYAKPYGIEQVQLSKVDFNPFKGVVQIHNLRLFNKQQPDKPVAKIGLLGVNLDLIALFQKRLWIQSLIFENAHLPFELKQNNQLFMAGIPLTHPDSETRKTSQENTSLSFLPGLDNIRLKQIQLSLKYHQQTTTLQIESLSLKELYAWNKEGYARLVIKSKLNQNLIKANLQLHLFSDTPKVVGTFQSDGIKLDEFTQFIPQTAWDFSGQLTSDITFTLAQTQQGITLYQQGELALNQVKLQQKNKQQSTKLQTSNIRWKGDLHLLQPTTKKTTTQLNLNGQLTANNLHANQLFNEPKTTYNAQFKKLKLQGKVRITQGTETLISVLQKLNIQALELGDSQNKIQLKTDLAANLNNLISINKGHFSLSQTKNNELTLNHLTAQQAHWFTQLNQINWQGRFNLNNQTELTIQSKGKIALNQLTLKNNEKQRNIAQLDALNISELNINNVQDIDLKNIQLQNLSVAKSNKQSGLVELKNIQLSQAHFQEIAKSKQLTLGHLAIKNSATHLTITKDNQIKELNNFLASMGNPVQKQTKTVAQKPAQPVKAFNYSLASVELSGENPVYINVEQTQPALKRTLNLNQLSLSKIASKTPQKTSKFSFNINLDEFSQLSSQGEFTPLDPNKHLKATTHLDGLALKDLSPLVEQKLGYQIQSGQLSANLSTQIDNNKINAKNDIKLNKFALESIDETKTQAIEEGFPVPLQAGLGLLQDKDDNISLSLPITGDLKNPNFKIQDVINTALGNALASASKAYLLLALQPFGAIALVGQYALEQGASISLQPIDFAAGSNQLSPKMQTYLKKLSKLLAERKTIQIKLCEGVSEKDRLALKKIALQASIKQQTDKDPKAKIVIPDITINNNDLLKLAEERQKVIKRYLINLGATNKQLILCKPKIARENQSSQVKLSI